MVLILILMVIGSSTSNNIQIVKWYYWFYFDLFAVATAITTHNNESERKGLDCEYVLENENAAFAPNWFK